MIEQEPLNIPLAAQQYWGAHLDQGSISISQIVAIEGSKRWTKYQNTPFFILKAEIYGNGYHFFDVLESDLGIKGYKSKSGNWSTSNKRAYRLLQSTENGVIMKKRQIELGLEFQEQKIPRRPGNRNFSDNDYQRIEVEQEMYERMKELKMAECQVEVPTYIPYPYVAGALEQGLKTPVNAAYRMHLRSYPLAAQLARQHGGSAANIETDDPNTYKYWGGIWYVHREIIPTLNADLGNLFKYRFRDGIKTP